MVIINVTGSSVHNHESLQKVTPTHISQQLAASQTPFLTALSVKKTKLNPKGVAGLYKVLFTMQPPTWKSNFFSNTQWHLLTNGWVKQMLTSSTPSKNSLKCRQEIQAKCSLLPWLCTPCLFWYYPERKVCLSARQREDSVLSCSWMTCEETS